MQRIFIALFLLGFALLPLSSQGREQAWDVLLSVRLPFAGVYSPGLIVLWLAAAVGCLAWTQQGATLSRSDPRSIALGAGYIGLICALLPAVPDFKASSIRATTQVLGYLLFVVLLLRRDSAQKGAESYINMNLGQVGLVLFGALLSLYYLANTYVQTSFSSLESLIYSRFIGGVNSLAWGASNIVASVLLISFCAALLLFNATGGSRKILVLLCVISAGILATLSRNALLCVMIIAVVYAVVLGSRKMLWLTAVTFFIGGANEFLRRYNLLEDIFESRTSDLSNVTSVGGRAEIWQHYLAALYERPLGFNGFYSSLSEFGFSPHNWFLTTYWELGAIGVALGLALIMAPIQRLWRTARRSRARARRDSMLGVWLAFVVFLNLQSEDPQFAHQYIVCWWVWLAVLLREVLIDERYPTASHERAAGAVLLPRIRRSRTNWPR